MLRPANASLPPARANLRPARGAWPKGRAPGRCFARSTSPRRPPGPRPNHGDVAHRANLPAAQTPRAWGHDAASRLDTMKKTPQKVGLLGGQGAGNETRTRDFNLGKVALYQLSYSRVGGRDYAPEPQCQQEMSHGSRGDETWRAKVASEPQKTP